jgi:hypothetical protein
MNVNIVEPIQEEAIDAMELRNHSWMTMWHCACMGINEDPQTRYRRLRWLMADGVMINSTLS